MENKKQIQDKCNAFGITYRSGLSMKKRYIQSGMVSIHAKVMDIEKTFIRQGVLGRHLMALLKKPLLKKLESYQFYLEYLDSPENDRIDDMDIQLARQYPISQIIDTKNNYAKCIWHDDNSPSMYTKKNFAYCFSCGESGDVIDIAMSAWGIDFVSAVKRLCL